MAGKSQFNFSLSVTDAAASRKAADDEYRERLKKLDEKYSFLGPMDIESVFSQGREEYKRLFPEQFESEQQEKEDEEEDAIVLGPSSKVAVSSDVDDLLQKEGGEGEEELPVRFVLGVVFTDRLVVMCHQGMIGGFVGVHESDEKALQRYSIKQTGVLPYASKYKGTFQEAGVFYVVYLIPYKYNLDMESMYADDYDNLKCGHPMLESVMTFLEDDDVAGGTFAQRYGEPPTVEEKEKGRCRLLVDALVDRCDSLTSLSIHYYFQECVRKLQRCHMDVAKFVFRRKGRYVKTYFQYVSDENNRCVHDGCLCSLTIRGLNQFEGYEYVIGLSDRNNVIDFFVDLVCHYDFVAGEIVYAVPGDEVSDLTETERVIVGIIKVQGEMFPATMRAKLKDKGFRCGRGELVRFVRSERSGLKMNCHGQIAEYDGKVIIQMRKAYEMKSRVDEGSGDEEEFWADKKRDLL